MINNIASWVTVALFVIYLFGRGVAIIKDRHIYYDNIRIINPKEIDYETTSISNYIEIGDSLDENLLLTSNDGIYNLRVYKNIFDKNECFVPKKLKEIKEIKEIPFVNAGESVQIITHVPEGYAKYVLKFYTADYKKVILPLKMGGATPSIKIYGESHHTIKSFLYYFCK